MTGSRGRRSAPHRRLLRQQAVAPLGRIERAFGGEDAGPGPRQDFEKGAHDLPMLGHIGRREVARAARSSPLRSQRCRETARGRRRAPRPGPAAAGRDRAVCPSSSTSRVNSSRRRSSGIAGGTARSAVVRHALDQGQLVRIEIADRPHPRQQQRRARSRPSGRTRRNASRRARTARRVGSRTVMRGSASGSPPATASNPSASVARNGRSGAIV